MAKPSSMRPTLIPPPEERVREILESLRTFDSSTAAILGAAYLDHGLRVALEAKFKNADKLKEVFDPMSRGTLSTTGNKITLARLMGILGDISENDLKCIFKIRNVFAHPLDTHNFEHGEINKNINKLKIVRNEIKKGIKLGIENNTSLFHFTVVYLYCGLTGVILTDPAGRVILRPGAALP